MNREIKFRAWDIDNKEYEYDIAIRPINGIIGVEIFNNEMQPVEFRGIVEQYTGIHDINGKEICEGDVCRLIYYTKSKKQKKWHKHSEDINVVEFEDGYFKFSNKDKYGIGSELSFSDYYEWSTADGSYKYEAEIIGNIHEEIKKC